MGQPELPEKASKQTNALHFHIAVGGRCGRDVEQMQAVTYYGLQAADRATAMSTGYCFSLSAGRGVNSVTE